MAAIIGEAQQTQIVRQAYEIEREIKEAEKVDRAGRFIMLDSDRILKMVNNLFSLITGKDIVTYRNEEEEARTGVHYTTPQELLDFEI